MPTTNLGRVAIVPQGAYSAAVEYKKLDIVTDAGNSYMYTNDTPSTGTALSAATHWLKIAEKGDQGNQDIVTAAESARDLASGYASTASDKADAAAASALQLASGVASPAGTYASLAALISANPDHAKIYVVTADGKWYYWNGSAWTAGGVYQATAIADASVNFEKLSFMTTVPTGTNLSSIYKQLGVVIDAGHNLNSEGTVKSITFPCEPGKSYHISVVGAHDRFRVVGTVATTGQTTWDELLINNDTITGNYEVDIVPQLSNIVIVYVSNSNQTPTISVFENQRSLSGFIMSGETVGVDNLNFISYGDEDIDLSSYYIPNDNIIVGVDDSVGSFITRTPLLSPGVVNTVVYTIEPNTTYVIEVVGTPGDKWRIAIMDTPIDLATIPTFVGIATPASYIVSDRAIVVDDVYAKTTFYNTTGVQLFIYASATNQQPDIRQISGGYIFDREIDITSLPESVQTLVENAESNLNQITFLDSLSLYSSTDLISSSFMNATGNVPLIYDGFDALVTAYPNYVSRRTLGRDQSDTYDIYEYRFRPETVGYYHNSFATETINEIALPLFLIDASIHGDEKIASLILLRFFEKVCNSWADYDAFEFFRWNIEFRVIPISNPWGFNANNRLNSEGLDLNRQFLRTDEQLATDANEVLILRNWLKEFQGLSQTYVGMHTMWSGVDRDLVWLISPEGYFDKIGNSIITKLSRLWKSRYAFITYEGLLGFVGEGTYVTPANSGCREYAYLTLGYHNSLTVEVANTFNYTGHNTKFGVEVTNVYMDWLVGVLCGCATTYGAIFK